MPLARRPAIVEMRYNNYTRAMTGLPRRLICMVPVHNGLSERAPDEEGKSRVEHIDHRRAPSIPAPKLR